MKAPSKADLREQIAYLQKQNEELREQQEAAKREEWNKRIPEAIEKVHEVLHETFPNLVANLQYNHVDAGGYWFSFNLVNDDRIQTYCVRHSDLTTTED